MFSSGRLFWTEFCPFYWNTIFYAHLVSPLVSLISPMKKHCHIFRVCVCVCVPFFYPALSTAGHRTSWYAGLLRSARGAALSSESCARVQMAGNSKFSIVFFVFFVFFDLIWNLYEIYMIFILILYLNRF